MINLNKTLNLTHIDLFAGIGGFRYALEGIPEIKSESVFSSEKDKYCQLTYEKNYGEKPEGDIRSKSVLEKIPRTCDLLTAGFPCQAFSMAGKRRGFSDTRGTLFHDVWKIMEETQPKAFFLENVKGLLSHDSGSTFETILHILREELNYYVPTPELLNAKDFGLPQNRERVFIVGFRKDQIKAGINFEFPKPARVRVKSLNDIIEKNPVSVKYYLSDTYLETLKKHKVRHEKKGNGFGYKVLNPAKGDIAGTIVIGGMGKERNLLQDHKLEDFTPVTKIKGKVNREGIRRMTPREWSRLQGFGEEFDFSVVSDAQAYKQFANSVPVPAVRETIKQIIKYLS